MANPIVCSVCGQPATVFVSTIVGGDIREVAYCAEHGKQAGVMDPAAYGFMDAGLAPEAVHVGAACAQCGITLDVVKSTSRLGCAACYEVFEDYLEEVLKRMQKNSMHLGKIPKRALGMDVVKERVKVLEKSLDELVKNEQFEDAALVRDAITHYKVIIEELLNANDHEE